MHIAEGFLPLSHALTWSAVAAPFVGYGVRTLPRRAAATPEAPLVLGAAGAFTLLLSSLKLPSVGGSSSHPTGVALGTNLSGPAVMAALGPVVLLFQALFLAHGGLTTLGANTFAMAIVGPWVSWGVWRAARALTLPMDLAVGLGTACGVLGTYLTTVGQLALAFPDASSGSAGAFMKFASIFAVTQLPLSVVEALLTLAALNVLAVRGLAAVHGRA